MCDSLSQFFVTFCLLEMIYSCDYRKTTDSDLASLIDQQSSFVVPLWIDGPFPKFADDDTNYARPMQRVSFHLVQSQVLISTLLDCAGTMIPDWYEKYPEYFRKSYRLQEKEKPSTTMDRDVAMTSPHVPLLVRKQLIEISIRKHQRQADHHSERAAFYRGLLLDVQRDLRECNE